MHPDELPKILAVQQSALAVERPVPIAARKDRLKRLALMTIEHRDALVEAMSKDFGHRSREQSLISDISGGVLQVKHALAHVEQWARPERRRLAFPMGLLGARAWIEYQPKGVIGVIVPWNFPVQLTVGPLAGVFAAGNRGMVKSSEVTPTVAALFEKIAPKYFDAAELAFFSGGPDVGRAFAALPFDHLLFTGATGVGRHILHAAADNLVPVTLELGGKSPTIIGRTADVAAAADRIATGKMMNAGQICLAPDYLFVPEESEAAAIDGFRQAVGRMYPTLLANPDYTSIVNDRHAARLAAYVDDARSKGARVIEINPADEPPSARKDNRMPFYLILDPTDEMAVMQEEIFGPILPVLRYRGIDAVIAYINARDRPLSLYYFGADAAEQRQILERTVSGGVTLNDVVFHAGIDDLPFGGVGPSGMGSYHGIDGFRTFSHAKAIYKQARVDLGKLGGMKPPYGKSAQATIARSLKL